MDFYIKMNFQLCNLIFLISIKFTLKLNNLCHYFFECISIHFSIISPFSRKCSLERLKHIMQMIPISIFVTANIFVVGFSLNLGKYHTNQKIHQKFFEIKSSRHLLETYNKTSICCVRLTFIIKLYYMI